MVDPSSGRATLLESIRQAGGIGKAKLRSVKERKLEKKKQKEQEQGEGTLRPLQSRALRKRPPSNHHQTPRECCLPPHKCLKANPLLSIWCLLEALGGQPDILVSAAWVVGSTRS